MGKNFSKGYRQNRFYMVNYGKTYWGSRVCLIDKRFLLVKKHKTKWKNHRGVGRADGEKK